MGAHEDPETAGADEVPDHWAGEGHEDEEIRVHHSSLYVRMMGSMQLAAMGLHGWVSGATCFCCLSLSMGAMVLSGLLLVRGVLALLEVADIGREYHLIFLSESLYAKNPFILLAHTMLLIGGIGDLVAAMCGGFGVMFRQVMPTFVLPAWLFVHTLGGIIFTMIISTFDTIGIGSGFTLLAACLFLVIPDMYFVFISLQTLLIVTWQGTVAPSMQSVLYAAENSAVKYGSSTIDMNHLIAGLLEDEEDKHLLEYGGVNVKKMEHELKKGGKFLAGEKYGVKDDTELLGYHDPLPFGPDAVAVLAEAAREQWKAYETRLTADHLIITLTAGGSIALKPKGKQLQEVKGRLVSDEGEPSVYPVPQARAIRQYVEEHHRETCTEPGPPPAPVFGCLPVEECVMVYIVVQVILCLLSVLSVLFMNRSLGVVAGLRTVEEMRLIELLSSAVGMILGCVALFFITLHRKARVEIRQASFAAGGRWAAELDDAWNRVRKDDHAQSAKWLEDMKAGALYLSFNLGWNVVQLFVDVPVFLSVLTFGNVCGSYNYGLMKASASHLQSLAPMHCTRDDVMLIGFLVGWVLLKLYMCWSMFALWHEYAYGWTTTEIRGAAYLDPMPPLPQTVTRQLAGLPKVPQKRLADEKTPLML